MIKKSIKRFYRGRKKVRAKHKRKLRIFYSVSIGAVRLEEDKHILIELV